jgi:hypothetical protein
MKKYLKKLIMKIRCSFMIPIMKNYDNSMNLKSEDYAKTKGIQNKNRNLGNNIIGSRKVINNLQIFNQIKNIL